MRRGLPCLPSRDSISAVSSPAGRQQQKLAHLMHKTGRQGGTPQPAGGGGSATCSAGQGRGSGRGWGRSGRPPGPPPTADVGARAPVNVQVKVVAAAAGILAQVALGVSLVCEVQWGQGESPVGAGSGRVGWRACRVAGGAGLAIRASSSVQLENMRCSKEASRVDRTHGCTELVPTPSSARFADLQPARHTPLNNPAAPHRWRASPPCARSQTRRGCRCSRRARACPRLRHRGCDRMGKKTSERALPWEAAAAA